MLQWNFSMNAAPIKNALGVFILGAGASARMGRPKLLLPWSDTTVIGRIIATWRELGAGQIAIVMRPDDALLAAELDRLKFSRTNCIFNPHPEQGMFSSILCAANWPDWRASISSWTLVLGDQPQLDAKALRPLLAFHAQNPGKICQPSLAGHGAHPVIFPRSALEQLKTTTAATLKDCLKLMASSCVQCEMDAPGLLLDLDTPEDYIRLQSR